MSGFKARLSERKSYEDEGVERHTRLLIIATEGRITEYAYFTAVNMKYGSVRVRIEPYPKQDDNSAPEYVVQQLSKIKNEFVEELDEDDELWVVIDVDSWGTEKLSSIVEQCKEEKYGLAVSNSCFELWLLLHLNSLADYSEDEANNFLGSRGPDNLKRELEAQTGFNHKKPKFSAFLDNERMELAVKRAKEIDNLHDPWPQQLGSRIYQIIDRILDW